MCGTTHSKVGVAEAIHIRRPGHCNSFSSREEDEEIQEEINNAEHGMRQTHKEIEYKFPAVSPENNDPNSTRTHSKTTRSLRE